MKKLFLLLAFAALTPAAKADNVPAFPGAEGFARYTTTGGRGTNGTTKVYHVTNLNDNGNGSLRWALSQSGPRTIVFDVSGYIDLRSDINVSSNTTIAGQTAPGCGITVRYYTVNFTKCDNVIVRFIRFRRSQIKNVNDGADAAWGRNHKNIILDHCSFSWSIDELASFYDNRNFTMQWCNLVEALCNPGHSKGAHSYGGIWGGKNASFHHNFMAHVQNRAPRFNGARYNWTGYDATLYKNPVQAERVDYRNCVVYNWGNGNGCYGGPGGGYINMVNNYYKAGPGTKNKTRLTQVSVAGSTKSTSDNNFPNLASRYYISGNYVAAATSPENYDWKGVIYDDGLATINGEKYIMDTTHYYGTDQTYVKNGGVDYIRLKLDSPIEAGDITTHSAQKAFEKVVEYSGACLYRDAVDARTAEEAKNGTTTYTGSIAKTAGIIDVVNNPDSTADQTTVSYPELNGESRPAGFDTDGDGMPDAWETANGLNPNDASDATLYTIDTEKGWYTNLEVYLNYLVESIVKAQNADAASTVDEYYPKQSAGINSTTMQSEIISIEYYTLNGIRISEPQQGISIRKIKLAGGQNIIDKVLKK